jgi:hypothetical protein
LAQFVPAEILEANTPWKSTEPVLDVVFEVDTNRETAEQKVFEEPVDREGTDP